MKNQPITPEGQFRLETTINQMIVEQSSNIDLWIRQKKSLPEIRKHIEGHLQKHGISGENALSQIDENFKIIDRVNSFAIHLCYLYCDLGTAIKHYLSAELDYEKRYAVKLLNVIMIEGYKRIYGFEKDKIKISLWVKSLEDICKSVSSECANKYNELTQQIIEIGQSKIFDKDNRDLAVHYDTDVEKVYALLLKLSAEDESQKVIEFLKLLEQLIKFSGEILIFKNKELEKNNPIDKLHNYFQDIQDKIPDELKQKFSDSFEKLKKTIANILK